MPSIVVGLILVPLLDQAVKAVVRRRVDGGAISLGPIGEVRVVHTHIWMLRAARPLTLGVLWTLWIFAASALGILSVVAPSLGWCAGLLLGGSFSHAFETSLRGSICDYVCLRVWPAFNMADVAMIVGVCGTMTELFWAIRTGWS